MLQLRDDVLTQEQSETIQEGAKSFVNICISSIRDFLRSQNIEEKEEILNRTKHLSKLSERERIVIGKLMQFFQKHVQYDTSSNFGTTFIGLAGFGTQSVIDQEGNDNRVRMDCDIMTIVAHEILSKLGVLHTFAVQYEKNDEGRMKAYHANGVISGEFIERTNYENYGYIPSGQEINYILKEDLSQIAGTFLNTYPAEISAIQNYEKNRIRYTTDIDDPNIPINIFYYSNRILEEIISKISGNGEVTTADIEIFTDIARKLQIIALQGERKNDERWSYTTRLRLETLEGLDENYQLSLSQEQNQLVEYIKNNLPNQ